MPQPINPIIKIPPEYKLGPAMRKLNEKQRAFVMAMLDFGGKNHTRAAEAAGYGYPGCDINTLHCAGYRVAHDPDVQEAIREEGQARLNGSAIMAVNTLLDIADDPTTEKKDRLKALEMIMNRTGLVAKTEHNVTVTKKDLTSEEMIKRISHLATNMGMDPQKLLGGPAVDAEFSEVDDDSIDDIL